MRKAILMILDGFGLGPDPKVDAIYQANTPCFDKLMKENPHSSLTTHGLSVGLPEGQMGNSEVGHINLGAGRVVYQDLTKIDLAIAQNSISQQAVIKKLIADTVESGKNLHLIGLVSDGGVHSHIDHLLSLIDVFEKSSIKNIFIHAIADGRDTDPKSFIHHLKNLKTFLHNKKSRLATIVGRYYAMDRDKRWERISEAYQLYVHNKGELSSSAENAVLNSYKNGITDEFIKPIQLTDESGSPYPSIQDNDSIFCFNFRSDRMRQLTRVLHQHNLDEFSMRKLSLKYYTMTEYDSEFNDVHVVFQKDEVSQSLGEVLSRFGLSQLRIAETEKYPHVSYFFNGGREKPFSGERRILIPSPKVATYDLKPSMSAVEVTDALLNDMNSYHPDFICLNFANTDMVGHTGVMSAAIEAAQVVDQCMAKIIELANQLNYEMIILADHGNADCMINPDGTPNTAHTKNPVPCILISSYNYKIKNGKLADIAPTLLHLMQLPVPSIMTGNNLVENS